MASDDAAGPAPGRPGPASRGERPAPRYGPRAHRPARRSGRREFREWRRTRPFWGGLLLIIAGLEMLLIPLTGVLARGQIKLVIYVGIGGVFGILIGALLIACGLALWFNQAHKTFYAITGVLLSILSFIGTNLGGFFIGMLLGAVGGSLAFGWTPVEGSGTTAPSPPPPPAEPDQGVGLVLGRRQADDDTLVDLPRQDPAPHSRWRGHGTGPGRMLAITALTALAAGTLVSASAAHASAAETVPAQARSSQGCILLVICSGSSPSPSPSPSGGSGGSGGPGGSGGSGGPGGSGGSGGSGGTGGPGGSGSTGGSGTSPLGGLLPTGSPSPGASSAPGGSGSAGAKKKTTGPNNKKSSPTAGLVVASTKTVLTASTVNISGMAYQGVVNMPVAGGGTVQMMKFTMTSQAVTTATQTASQPSGSPLVTKLTAATFAGGVTLYATELQGTLKLSSALPGVPLTLTPGNVESTLLQFLKTLTPHVPVTMDNVTVDQPVVLSPLTDITGLIVSRAS